MRASIRRVLGPRSISTVTGPCLIHHHHRPQHPQRVFRRNAMVAPGIFPIHKLPLMTFLRHQSVAPKNAEIEETKPQIKARYKLIYTCGV